MSDRTSPATAAILTLGCKLNIADSEAMARRLRDAGWNVVDRLTPDTGARAVIVNSCSVTHVADQKSRHLVRLARRLAPDATVAFTGCMLETAPRDQLDALAADLIYHQPNQLALADRLIQMHPVLQPAEFPLPSPTSPLPRQGEGESEDAAPRPSQAPHLTAPRTRTLKTRAFISAQEGCNDLCAFCIIPKTRGRERSKSVDAVVAEALAREAEGVQEIVITGTQLGAYGRDWGHRTPYPVLKALIDQTSIPRIRMSSLQPQDLSDEVIDLWQSPRLCRHFHLALQSGSAAVLQRMRRRYTRDEYRDAVRRLRNASPDVAITTDVIVGFPGETEAEFEASFAFCEEIQFAGIHVFPYSQRSGTVAFKMPDQVSDPVKKQRVHRLIELADRMSAAYRARFLGQTTAVLWEPRRGGAWEGLTDTYIRVRAESSTDLTNQLTSALLLDQRDGVMWAQITEEVTP
ncbi:MAG TPA: tRNA (N(6)-L-threonylcarbamoyladenosine(37)-C(2))-methylthiotransferase MtaB [Dehalococcoidia bacterium]|nr:tRNA (N(6)-L-threonylcarbamoyladenosine(37)-C(2))-methylthiotransferase MtaB [Dehalococcoidia bacterium]